MIYEATMPSSVTVYFDATRYLGFEFIYHLVINYCGELNFVYSRGECVPVTIINSYPRRRQGEL